MLNKNHNISGESFFSPFPEDFLSIESDFVPFDKSIVWYMNDLFWHNTKLWEKTYGEHYEKSLPTGLSSSHEPEFIKKSAMHFLQIVNYLKKNHELPKKNYILEQAPGSGKYAQGFLDIVKKEDLNLYLNLTLVLSDNSAEILQICRENLKNHLKRVLFHQQKSDFDLPPCPKNKFLFARHGNFWDQLPCKIFQKTNGKIYEINTIASIDKNFEKVIRNLKIKLDLEEVIALIRKKQLSALLQKHPLLWKPLIRDLKLKTKLSTHELKTNLYDNLQNETYIINNLGVLKNLSGYLELIDWQHHGYLEVMDIIFPNISSFTKDRLPKKYDGALGVGINGPEVKLFLQNKNLFFSQKSIKGINSQVRVFKNELESLLLHEHFFTIAEIAPRREQSVTNLKEKTNKLFSLGTDIVAFSDQAGAGEQFYPIEDLVESQLFNQINGALVMANIAVRRKTKKTLLGLFAGLKNSEVKNIFVLAGDPGASDSSDKLTWREVIPLATKDFFVGAVAHPDIKDLKNSMEKQRIGADFLIVQACYDEQKWKYWLEEIKAKKLYQKIPLIPVIIPITSAKMLSVIDSLPDIALSEKVKNDFLSLGTDEKIKEKGIELAKKLLKEYRGSEVFSGVYLYSKSEEIVKKILE